MGEISPKDYTRIKYAIKDKIMHFAATISPAPKNEEKGEIESLNEAVNYYAKAGIKKLIIQPKYMGSYCDIYLHKDIDKTEFYSRRGYRIKSNVDRVKIIAAVTPLWERLFNSEKYKDAEVILIQSELMPWAALGEGLIESEFRGYLTCHKSHSNYIGESNLSDIVNSFKESAEYKEYLSDRAEMTKDDLYLKYPGHIRAHYDGLSNLFVKEYSAYQKSLALYEQQVDIYGKSSEMHIKPFNVLKTIYSDREVVNECNITGFKDVSADEVIIIDLELSDDEVKQQIDDAYKKYHYWCSELKYEGVVIKPDIVHQDKLCPMFKVRNNDYLQMIYGINFQDDYQYYLSRRKVGTKMRCSTNEWNISRHLLSIPLSEINSDNDKYVKLIKARILEERFEETLDTRL